MNTKYIKHFLMVAMLGSVLSSCNDYLDKEPLSNVTPENYLTSDSQLEAYANQVYSNVLTSHSNWSYGTFGNDTQTDNQTSKVYDNKYVKGKWKVPLDNGSDWNFKQINTINYFFDEVLPKLEEDQLGGALANVRHYIGEMYFLRAYEYFKRYQMFGDFPIIEHALADDQAILTEASKRFPRNQVARFILSDLDKAIDMMRGKDMPTTRINYKAALLFKSRVALYEGSWLKNFANTPFVPGSAQWPGKDKDYNAGFAFDGGSIESEYNWFFQQAMDAAKEVGDIVKGQMIINSGIVPQTQTTLSDVETANPYLAMFGTENLSSNPEVLLWRQYSKSFGITHCVVVAAQNGDYGVGITRGMVDGFLMKNGLPIYAQGSGYLGDQTIANVRLDRDPRLTVFLKEPGQKNILIEGEGSHAVPIEPIPNIMGTAETKCYTTGYALRKGGSFDQAQCDNGASYTGCPILRGVEALLNYMEACYELNGSLDQTAEEYWVAIRARHTGMDTDFQKTINNTVVSQEALNDWGAYTGGALVDATLYNIRRERRCELMAEGLRWMDLCRWRALDQMITTPYHIEGIHIWNTPMEDWYDGAALSSTISSSSRSEYIRPYESDSKSEVFDGYTWSMAHYLHPIMIKQFLLTSSDGATVETSPLYQNPYWPAEANLAAEQ